MTGWWKRPSQPAAALFVIAAVLIGLTSCGISDESPDHTPSSGTPAPSVRVTQQPTGPPSSPTATAYPSGGSVAWKWAMGPHPGGPVRGAAKIGPLWVALDDLQAWTSADGLAWSAAAVDGTPQESDGQLVLGRVAVLGDAAFSVGMWFGPGDSLHPVVWSSPDGTSWQQVRPATPWGYLANDVASNGAQLAVAGSYYDFGDGRVWTSTDARTWTERVSSGGPATLNAIHGDGDGFVAVGFRVAAGGAYAPTIWYSADGLSWADAAVPATDSPVTLLDVTRVPGGRYVALGIRGNEVDAGRFVAWYADDPASWADAGVIAGGMVPGLLAPVGGGVFAIITGFDGPEVAFSQDGATWESQPPLELPNVLVHAGAVASNASRVVIFGSTEEADAHYVWLGGQG